MKGIRNIIVAGCSLFLLCQCATRDDVRKLNYQVRAVNQRVEEVKSTTVDQMQKRQASSVSKIDQVGEELLQLKARLEENAHQEKEYRRQNMESLTTLQTAIEERLATDEQKIVELQQQVAQLSAGLESMQQARLRAAEQRARDAARKAELARKRTVMAASAVPGPSIIRVTPQIRKMRVSSGQGTTEPVAEKPSRTTETIPTAPHSQATGNKASVQTVVTPDTVSGPLEQAMAKFKKGQYKEAYRGFEQVLASNPRGKKAAQTLFYMGEALYNQGEFDLAILDYQKVISNHAKDSHTPSALLKQGMSFEKLTDNETAKIIYNKLINEYADSPEAAKARQRLKNL
ncbi:MAG TPA: tol-pal system protein YbgF [Desulfobulbus sp.]|nr:tol-pal system protein YbgF [Desulfobulbus sp.]